MNNNNNNTTTTEGDSNITTDMEKAMSQEQNQQLTLQDDRIIKIDTGYIDDVPTSLPNIVSDMNTSKMSSEDLMRMPLITKVIDWSITSERNDVLVSFDIPSIFDEIDLYHKRILELYNFTNFTLRMDFRINTTPFHSGRLVVFFDPMDLTRLPKGPRGVTARDLNVFRASMQPGVELDAGTNNVASLDIPWEHFLSYLNMNNDIGAQYQNGTIYVLVQNKLFVPTNAPNSVALNILLSCKDVNLEIPVRPHSLQFIRPQVVEPNMGFAKTATGAAADALTGNLSGAASKGVSALAQFLNLDKPAQMDTKVTNCLSTASPLSHVVGIDGSVRLSTDPESGYLENHFSLAPPSEKNITEIVKLHALFDIKPWTIEDNVNTEIASFKVRPGLTGLNLTKLSDSPLIYRETPTYLSYLEKSFRFWSGGIVFKFKFASSQNHSGKLQFSFEPTITPKAYGGETVTDYGQGPSIIFDLKESKTLEFHVPYVADRPSLLTSNLDNPEVDEYGNDHCLGTLRVKVLNKLTTTGNIAPSIDMNCYISGAPDFEFDVLSIRTVQALAPLDVAFPMLVTPNMETDTTKTRAEDKDEGFSIVKGNRERTRRNRFNDQIEDVRDACKRYTLLCEDAIVLDPYNMWATSEGGSAGIFAGTKTYPVGMRTGSIGRTPSSNAITLFYFSNMYVFKSGSFRYKIIPIVDRTIPIIWKTRYGIAGFESPEVYPDNYKNTPNETYPQTIQNSSQDVGIEVEMPYYSTFNQHLVSYDPNIPTTLSVYAPYTSGDLHLIAKTCDISKLPLGPDGTRKAIPYEVYIAAGNDYNLRFLVSPPDIYRSS